MKKLLVSAIAAVMLVMPMVPVAQAGSASNPFNVTVTLTSSCTIGTIANVAFGTYVAGQTTSNTATGGGFNMTCTNTLPITSFTLDALSPLVAGLTYSLTLPTPLTGTGAAQAYTIGGTMASGQYGTCATASCTGTQTRTLTVNF